MQHEAVPEWEQESDYLEFKIHGLSYMYKPHKKKRMRKKYKKNYAQERKIITLHCQIIRVFPQLHLCGYVNVPQQHPLWGKDAFKLDLDVHGGLTFGRKQKKSFKFGFDCAHWGDFVPGLHRLLIGLSGQDETVFSGATYRNMHYVTREVISLANQLFVARRNEVE